MTGDATVEPSAFPGRGAAATAFVEVHGTLLRHAWLEEGTSADAYRLFSARSEASGWLMPDDGSPGGLWAMNDAAEDEGPGSRVAWFQVQLAPPGAGRAVPIHTLLACAGETLARLGTLVVDDVHVLLPAVRRPVRLTPSTHIAPLVTLLSSASWFAGVAPATRTPVHLTVAGPATVPPVADVAGWIRQLRQDVFHLASVTEDPVIPPPLPAWAAAPGPRGLHVSGALVEWSLDALGWLVALLSDALERHDVAGPVVVSAHRDPGPPNSIPS